MKKNDLITAEITAVSAEGSGIARHEGMAVFVPGTAPGDVAEVRVVKVKSRYAYGILNRLITPSSARCENDCPVFHRCGGCVFRHISYQSECEIKQSRVAEAVRRIGGIDRAPAELIPADTPVRYRNKAQYPVSPDGTVGFYAVHSHRIVPCDDCLLQPQEFSAAAAALGRWIRENRVSVYDERSGAGLVRHLYLRRADVSGEIMAVVVVNCDRVPRADRLVEAFRQALGDRMTSVQLNVNTADTNVILGERCIPLYGQEFITDTLCGVRVRLSPLSFYQVNRTMAERLYEKAAEYACPDGREILDLYCGAGTIGLSMARRARHVTGVEIVPQAVEDARRTAAENGIENVDFICADAAEAAKQLAERGIRPQVVIVDPPRKGCVESLLHTIAHGFCPERLVYISCDPATFARDAARLDALGYALIEYTPVDLFPRTAHVETVALLSRQKPDGQGNNNNDNNFK